MSGCMTRHSSSTLSWRVNRVLGPTIAACSRTSYGVGPSPPAAANSMSSSTGAGLRRVGPVRGEDEPHAGRGIELDHELIRLALRVAQPEAQPGRELEDEPQLGLGHRQGASPCG